VLLGGCKLLCQWQFPEMAEAVWPNFTGTKRQ